MHCRFAQYALYFASHRQWKQGAMEPLKLKGYPQDFNFCNRKSLQFGKVCSPLTFSNFLHHYCSLVIINFVVTVNFVAHTFVVLWCYRIFIYRLITNPGIDYMDVYMNQPAYQTKGQRILKNADIFIIVIDYICIIVCIIIIYLCTSISYYLTGP